MENIYNEFGVLYMSYDSYYKNCEKQGKKAKNVFRKVSAIKKRVPFSCVLMREHNDALQTQKSQHLQ